MLLRKVMAAALLGVGAMGMAVAAEDGEDGHERHHRHVIRGHSVEMVAMHNILAELISAKTGKSVGEVQAAFRESHPHEAMEGLGIERADRKALFREAHATLVRKAQAAGLITAEQAEKLKDARFHHKHVVKDKN